MLTAAAATHLSVTVLLLEHKHGNLSTNLGTDAPAWAAAIQVAQLRYDEVAARHDFPDRDAWDYVCLQGLTDLLTYLTAGYNRLKKPQLPHGNA